MSDVVLRQSPRDLDTAYRNFFDGLKGKRPRTGAPRFESKRDNRQAVRFTANAKWKITPGGDPRLPKVGDGRVKWSRAPPSTPSTVTVIKDAAGRCSASSGAREREVAVAVGRGRSNAEIAAGLYTSVPTVKAHASRILAELGPDNRVQTALLVHDAGLLDEVDGGQSDSLLRCPSSNWGSTARTSPRTRTPTTRSSVKQVPSTRCGCPTASSSG
ncbi:LuxR C-terminal-related transcriptional regulator [Streptomyces sp. NK15101]|uniref:LuxR C-terminal-related transcriptional regulator n=1 Tax=Streptomyces sp. NK15101 TaxID=2873261 RepID=UPI0035A8F799